MAKKRSVPKSKSGYYWLVKSEPDVFSIDDLIASQEQSTYWDGVRNYQARNYMRDSMKLGDLVLFYHSNADPPAVVGIVEVVKLGYPDHTAFDPKDPHYDPKSKLEAPAWYMVDLRFVEKFEKQLELGELRKIAALSKMVLLQKGSRLSVQPVLAEEFTTLVQMGRGEALKTS